MRGTVLCGFLSLRLLVAQQSTLTGPVEGFTFDLPTGSFRAVIGLPGAASLGPPLLSGFEFGSVAPGKGHGIAFHGGHAILVSQFGSAPVLTSELSDTARQPEGVLWSADGSQALLYSLSGGWIQQVVGLPDAVRFESAIDLSSLGGTVAAVAADPSATRIAAAIQGNNSGVYVMDGNRDFASVRPAGKPIALAFSEDGRKLYILDGDTRQLSELSLGDSSSRDCSIDGLQDPVAIRVAHDAVNHPVLYVAARADRMVRTYDVSSLQVLANTPLDFEPTAIQAFGLHSFLLSPRLHDGDPLWCLTSVPQSMVYFVPATPLTSERTE
jgi:hypothetical protein